MRSAYVANKYVTPTGSVHKSRGVFVGMFASTLNHSEYDWKKGDLFA